MSKAQSQFEKKRQQHIMDMDAKYHELAKTNPLFAMYAELEDYYKEFLDFELVAVLPALPVDHPKSQTYYASGTVSAVFMKKNPVYDTENETFAPRKLFIFDSEFGKLYRYEKKPHSKDHHFVKQPTYDEMVAHLNANPVVVFFHGCDDGHVGLRFKSEKDAMEYIQAMDVFEDVFEDGTLQNHN